MASAEDSLIGKGWRGRIGPCNRGPAGGASAGTVVMSKRHIGLSHALCGDVCADGRFQMQHVGAVCKGGLHLGAIYLVDKIGPASATNLAILDKVAEVLRLLDGPWIIGGDFNATPEDFEATGFLDLIQGVAHYPEEPTCGRKTFDFFLVSRSLFPSVYAVRPVVDGASNPHSTYGCAKGLCC